MGLLPDINDSAVETLRQDIEATKDFGSGALTLAAGVRDEIDAKLAGGGLKSRTISVFNQHRARINKAVATGKGHQAVVACAFFIRDFKTLREP